MRKRVISTLLVMATTAGLFAGNVSAVYAEEQSSGDYEYHRSWRMQKLHTLIIP